MTSSKDNLKTKKGEGDDTADSDEIDPDASDSEEVGARAVDSKSKNVVAKASAAEL